MLLAHQEDDQMSVDFSALCLAVGLPAQASELASGRIHSEPFGMEAPPNVYGGYPPAAVPLWGQDLSCWAAWKHVLVPSRSVSFVYFHPEDGYRPEEVARTWQQFAVFSATCIASLEPDRAVKIEKLKLLGLDESDVAAIIDAWMPDIMDIGSHPVFRRNRPLKFVDENEAYDGEFPRNGVAESSRLPITCGLEYGLGGPSTNLDLTSAPWLLPNGGPRGFEMAMGKGDLSGAWLSLNSPGWLFMDACVAMTDLRTKAAEPMLDAIAETWLSVHAEMPGGY